MRLTCALLCVLAASGWDAPATGSGETTATGVVFHDANRNGTRDVGEAGVPRVRVSNGRDVVLTDEHGCYRLPVDDDTVIFVIKPRDWMTPVNDLNLPRFYYIHKPGGSPKLKYPGVAPTGPLPASIDFPLRKRPEPDRFRVLVFGDTQTENVEQLNYLAHDVVEDVIGPGTDAAFGLSLGDLVSDRLELFEPLNRTIALIGIPFYNAPGNHDIDHESPDDDHCDETFESIYGPPYYSFDYGPVHFVVLDNIVWYGPTEQQRRHSGCGLGERQLAFVRNDLRLVPKERLVVLAMHVPITAIAERRELFEILAEHPHTLSFSAHTHRQQHFFLGEARGWPGPQPHHHINFATACGCWWRGAPDEVGIPHATMECGAPNGWSLVTFDRQRYSVAFKAARRPADYQMNISAPEAVPAAKAGETEVLVNVFAGSERSTVEMRVEKGAWTTMKKVARQDPYQLAHNQAEENAHLPRQRRASRAAESPHIWGATLPADLPPGTHLIEVRTTEMFGQTYFGRRIIRVENNQARNLPVET